MSTAAHILKAQVPLFKIVKAHEVRDVGAVVFAAARKALETSGLTFSTNPEKINNILTCPLKQIKQTV